MQTDNVLRGGAVVATVLAAGLVTAPMASADSFVLRVAAGHPTVALEQVNQVQVTFVAEVTKRVAAETKHTVRFIEGYGGTIANLFEVLESTQKGIVDFGSICACFEPTKLSHVNLSYFVPFTTGNPLVAGPAVRQLRKEFDYPLKQIAGYDQMYLGDGATDDYGLGTKFEWTKMSDLQGKKIGAAGPNLPWLDYAGAAKVQTNLNEVYNAIQSGVYEGVVIFPTPYHSLKFGEVAKYYTLMGWNSVVVYPLTINNKTWAKLPPEVQKIVRESAQKYEVAVDQANDKKFAIAVDNLKKSGVTVREIPDATRLEMAKAIEPWVNEKAAEYEKDGVPGKASFKRYIELVKEKGGKPYPYVIK